MAQATPRLSKALVVVNTLSGGYDPQRMERALKRVFPPEQWTYDVFLVTENASIVERVRRAVAEGVDLVVASGGDGTVSTVVDGVAGTPVEVGIVPCGTGNALARELNIPIDIDKALDLLVTPHDVRHVDALQVGDKFLCLVLSVGVTPAVMAETPRLAKRLLGRFAYYLRGITQVFGLQPRRFTITVDGREQRVRAAEVIVTNTHTIGATALRWGPTVEVDDGEFQLCIVYAHTILDILALAQDLLTGTKRGRRVRYLTVRQSVRIEADQPMWVEGDGDLLGKTPVEGRLVPGAVHMIVPKPTGKRPLPITSLRLPDLPEQLARTAAYLRPVTPAEIARNPDVLTDTVTTPSGARFTVRVLRDDDAEPLGRYFLSLSEDTRRRYGPHPFTQQEADKICAGLDYNRDLRFVALPRREGPAEIVAYFILYLGVKDGDRRRYEARGMPLDDATDCTLAPSVADGHQEQGLGSAIMVKVMDAARRLGRKRMVLSGGVQATNARAIHFYDKFGFRRVGDFETKGNLNNHDMIMKL